MLSESEADEPSATRASSRLRSRNRSEFETTRWLQPAQADRGAQKPWTRSSISAPAPHRVRRFDRSGFITTSPPSVDGLPRRIESWNRMPVKCEIDDQANVPDFDKDNIHGCDGELQAVAIRCRVLFPGQFDFRGVGHLFRALGSLEQFAGCRDLLRPEFNMGLQSRHRSDRKDPTTIQRASHLPSASTHREVPLAEVCHEARNLPGDRDARRVTLDVRPSHSRRRGGTRG